jgi:pimeloyl-ACP methyl ester carboxylesterase
VEEMSEDVNSFLDALSLDYIDFLGFSLGGQCGQLVALAKPERIRRLILVGADPSAPLPEHEICPRGEPKLERFSGLLTVETEEGWRNAYTLAFFRDDDQGRAAADAYFKRLLPSEFNDNAQDGKLPSFVDVPGFLRQIAAIKDWWEPREGEPKPGRSFYRLKELKMPTLVMTGDDDYLVPQQRSWELMSQIDHTQLVIWPKAGHASIWQYAENFAVRINEFLDSDPTNYTEPRL